MKRKILTVLAILLGLAGLGVLLYPSVSNWMEQAKQRRQIAAYQEAQAQMEQERRAALLAEADRYNQKLAELGISFDMLGEAEKEALLIDGKSYDELLLAEDSGVMGYLEIEKIKLKLPIYHGVSEEALESGVGHLEGTSLPVGGETTHAILFGHRGLPSAKLFTDLDQLEEGDHFLIHVLNETLCYEVDKISVVKPEETSSLAVEEGKDLVTLLTCTPYGVNTERLLVRGHRVPYVEQEVADEKTPLSGISLHTNYLLWVIIGLVITTIFILVLYLKEKKLQKKKNETS